MGIQGLLPLLKSIQRPCNLKKFSGQTIGVDAYGWLHRGTVSCAIDLALGKPTQKFVDFCMHRVRMLQHFGVTPYIVFDGDYLPGKAATEAGRSSKREESKRRGLELYQLGKKSQAHLELQKAIDVSPEMAAQFINSLRNAGVQYLVAPYEADAQLVYLERIGIISGILSEDSDLLVFGAKCLLTKLDQHGDCIEINRADFTACKDISLVGWSDLEFRQMAILSGCDYLASISKMGLKTAYRLVRKHKCIEKILKAIQFEGQFRVPPGYLRSFQLAEKTFLHQRVFCPVQNALVMNTDPDGELDEDVLSVIGVEVERNVAIGVARGFLHPMTKQPMKIVKTPKRFPDRSPIEFHGEMAPRDGVKGYPSLDHFFTPNRMPLADIDPNSFTPSASQQRLLQLHSSRQWSGSAPRGGQLSTRSEISLPPTRIPTPRSAPALARRRGITPPFTGSYTAPPRPMKRQRLCAEEPCDSGLETPVNDENRASRFFSPKVSIDNRTIPIKPQGGGKMMSSPNLWSDDSLDEALANLQDIDSLKCLAKAKLPIFVDDDSENKKATGGRLSINTASRSASQTDTVASKKQNFEHDPFMDTPAASTSSLINTNTSAWSKGPVNFQGLKNAFARQEIQRPIAIEGQTIARSPLSSAAPKHNVAANLTRRIADTSKADRPVPSTLKATVRTKRGTPLERLGASALGRTLLKGNSNAAKQVPRRPVGGQKQERSPTRISTNRYLSTGSAANSRLVRDAYRNTSKKHVGSEDLMVHESEGELSTE